MQRTIPFLGGFPEFLKNCNNTNSCSFKETKQNWFCGASHEARNQDKYSVQVVRPSLILQATLRDSPANKCKLTWDLKCCSIQGRMARIQHLVNSSICLSYYNRAVLEIVTAKCALRSCSGFLWACRHFTIYLHQPARKIFPTKMQCSFLHLTAGLLTHPHRIQSWDTDCIMKKQAASGATFMTNLN